MLFSSLDTLLKVSKTTSPQKLSAYDCVTLYVNWGVRIIKISVLMDQSLELNLQHQNKT